MSCKSLIASACMILGLGSLASASDLYNTTSTSAGLVINGWNVNLADAQFFKTTSDHVITSVMSRWKGGTGASGTVTVTINGDNGGEPGSSVASVGSFDLSLLPDNTVTPVILSSLSINLAANTNYWLVFSSSNVQPGAGNQYAPSPTGTGSPFNLAQNSGSGWTTFSNVGIIGQITATANVPEPSTYAMGAVASFYAATLFARRKNRSGRDSAGLTT